MKIDLVYLWVDGNDEKWLAKKNEALAKVGKPLVKSSIGDNRWRDNDELKYSLRSVEKFAPWINHIFIITDEQTPAWLNTESSKVSIINQNDLIPTKYQPLYNSNAIEMFLHKIPNLSEHFLYANDDMFFGKPLTPDFFFDENKNPIVQMRWGTQREKFKKPQDKIKNRKHFQRTIHNCLYFVYEKTGIKYNLKITHAIEPMRKSYLSENIQKYEQELVEASATTFREATNIQRMVFPLLDNAQGRNTIIFAWHSKGKPAMIYDYRKDNFFKRFINIRKQFLFKFLGLAEYDFYQTTHNIANRLKKVKPSLFCVNDEKKAVNNFENITDFMNEIFPNKSEFEK